MVVVCTVMQKILYTRPWSTVTGDLDLYVGLSTDICFSYISVSHVLIPAYIAGVV